MLNFGLYGAILAVGLCGLNGAFFTGWSSPMIPKLLAGQESIVVTENEASWLISIMKIGSTIGCLSVIHTVDKIGRKMSLLLTVVPTLISWVMTACATTTIELYIARTLGGVTVGMLTSISPMYIAEISPPIIRGALGSVFLLLVYIGILVGYVIGTLYTMQQFAYVGIVASSIQVAIFVWFPETPYHLVRQKRYAAARASLVFLRGTKHVGEEMDAIMRSVEADPRSLGTLACLQDLTKRQGGKWILFLGICLMLVQTFSGAVIILNYAQTIFDEIDNKPLTAEYLSLILIILYVVTYILCIFLVDLFGRKPLMLFSAFGVTGSSIAIGVYFYLQENGMDIDSLGWLPTGSLFFYVITTSIGVGSLPAVVISEIFPMYTKAVCMGLCEAFKYLAAFAFLKLWGIITEMGYNSTAFFVLAVLNIGNFFFVLFYLPETRRKTLQQIQAYLIYE